MGLFLLVDFGSTYTKVTGVDLDNEEIIGTACAPTTVETDITLGLEMALEELQSRGLRQVKFDARLGCSSAAGGLRMIAIGIVPELTAAAAKMAALSAGARVEGVFAWELRKGDIERIDAINPDIILLTGGTDGGNRDIILHNARALADAKAEAPVVVAGNVDVRGEVKAILEDAGKDVRLAENVMPELGEVNVEPVREAIRQVFIDRIVRAKGLARAEGLLDGILMPTPNAVLKAATLLACGTERIKGLGELMIVDVGGATTDVYSVSRGEPERPDVIWKGLTPPYAHRTVEGDLGLRRSARALCSVVGKGVISALAGLNEDEVEKGIQEISLNPEKLPRTQEEFDLDFALGYLALKVAVERHVGRLEVRYTADGPLYLQYGKDLTHVPLLIGTGGF